MIAARNGMMGGSSDPLLAEALSCKEALSWIKELNLNKVIVETDSLMLAQAFNVSADNFSYFGSILGDCQIIAKDLIDVNLVWVRRSANLAAHSLARAACSESGRGSWSYVPPLLYVMYWWWTVINLKSFYSKKKLVLIVKNYQLLFLNS